MLFVSIVLPIRLLVMHLVVFIRRGYASNASTRGQCRVSAWKSQWLVSHACTTAEAPRGRTQLGEIDTSLTQDAA
jgi:hypothetical protein